VGLFGRSGVYPVGLAFQLAAELALEDINARQDVLPGYRLCMHPVDTQVSPAFASVTYSQITTTTKTHLRISASD
jgi:hypothetical protein